MAGRKGDENEASELSGLVHLHITCEDCGRKRRWNRSRIEEAQRQGFRTLPQLGDRLFCPTCRGRNIPGKNVTIVPVLRDRTVTR